MSSSEIGEMNIVAIKLTVRKELDKFGIGEIFKIKSEKYSIPYEKNMFKTTMKMTVFNISGENAREISSPA